MSKDAGQATTTKGPMTQADITTPAQQAAVDETRKQSLEEVMSGSRYGADPNAQGITAVDPNDTARLDTGPSVTEQIAQQEQVAQELSGTPATLEVTDEQITQAIEDAANFKKLYGDSENEKGDLRRRVDELTQQQERTLEMLSHAQTAPQQPFAQQPPVYPQPTSYPHNVTAPNAPTQTQAPMNFLTGEYADEALAKDVQSTLQDVFAPAFQQLEGQNAQLRSLVEQQAQAQYQATKEQAGITRFKELQLITKYPVLQTMQESPQKLAFMQSLLANEQATATPGNGTPAQAPPTAAQAVTERVVRRVTHVEPSQARTSEPVDKAAEFRREMAEAQRKDFGTGERARAMRAVFTKYGIKSVNDLGAGFIQP